MKPADGAFVIRIVRRACGAPAVGILLALSAPGAAAQDPARVSDSAAPIPSGTLVRIRTGDQGTRWVRGTPGRRLQSRCVIVMARQTDDPRDGVLANESAQFKVDVWRGVAGVPVLESNADPQDDSQWSAYPVRLLRRQEAEAGCPGPADTGQDSAAAPTASLLWSRCDHRGEGLIGGLAVGILLSIIEDRDAKGSAIHISLGGVGGWLAGRYLMPPKRGCTATAR